MHTFQFPYYGLCIPDVQLVDHADLALQTALELKQCISQLSTPGGEPLDVRIGLASGSSCAGLIGSCGINFVVTGDPRVSAQSLADTTTDIAIADVTDALLKATAFNTGLGHYMKRRKVTYCLELGTECPYSEYTLLSQRGMWDIGFTHAQQCLQSRVSLAEPARAELALGPQNTNRAPFKVRSRRQIMRGAMFVVVQACRAMGEPRPQPPPQQQQQQRLCNLTAFSLDARGCLLLKRETPAPKPLTCAALW